jgi:hypothetical protein
MFTADNANIIFDQLTHANNGVGRLKLMVGGWNFSFSGEDNYASFRFKAKAKNKANYMKITLNAMDTYDVEFGSVRGMNYTVRSFIEGLYFDQLKEYFENETALYLSLT